MDNIKTNNFATDWLIDRIGGSSNRDPETGKMKSGFFEGLAGNAFGLNVGLIERTKDINLKNTAANTLLESSTYTRDDLGYSKDQKLTEAGVKSAVKALEKKKAGKKEEKDRQYETTIRQEGYTQANKGIEAQLQASQQQFAHTSEQANLNRLHDSERADKRDALTLQMQVMQNDLSEKRMDYDRETRRMDKRSNAIAQLMSGLGSLGGAFSL